jgi:hypothetical protein
MRLRHKRCSSRSTWTRTRLPGSIHKPAHGALVWRDAWRPLAKHRVLRGRRRFVGGSRRATRASPCGTSIPGRTSAASPMSYAVSLAGSTSRLPRAVTFSASHCPDLMRLSIHRFRSMNFIRDSFETTNLKRMTYMNSTTSPAETFAARIASTLSALGVTSARPIRTAPSRKAPRQGRSAGGVRKLNERRQAGQREGSQSLPVVDPSTALTLHVAGQSARTTRRDAKEWTIESHTTIVMDKIKKACREPAGEPWTPFFRLNVFLVNIEHWDGMHKVFCYVFSARRPGAHNRRGGRTAWGFAGGDQLHRGSRGQVDSTR